MKKLDYSMYRYNIALLFMLLFLMPLAKTQTETPKERLNRELAFTAVKEMKAKGVIVVRLETYHLKISSFERSLNDPNLKGGKRKRVQTMLDEAKNQRDEINRTMANIFLDSFHFCPVYLCYDTSANSLKNGRKQGIFVNKDLKIDPSISISDTAEVFVAYYHEKSGEYPTDGLMLRKLLKVLDEPFPKFTPIRESLINEVNTPKIRRTILILDDQLRRLLARAEKRG